jgi:hypothetical protein
MEFSYQDIRRLAEMLKPTEEDSDSEDDLPQSGLSKLGKVLNISLHHFTMLFLSLSRINQARIGNYYI